MLRAGNIVQQTEHVLYTHAAHLRLIQSNSFGTPNPPKVIPEHSLEISPEDFQVCHRN